MNSQIKLLWKIKLINGQTEYYTNCDQEINFAAKVYHPCRFLTPNIVFGSNQIGEDEFSFSGLVTENDKFNCQQLIDSYFELLMLNLNGNQATIIKIGWVREIQMQENSYIIRLETLSEQTKKVIGKCYGNLCRANLGDKFCKVQENQITYSGKIDLLINNSIVIDHDFNDDENDYSHLIFTTGLFKNKSFLVARVKPTKIFLHCLFQLKLSIGDQFKLFKKCNKTINDCTKKFNNAINFRGEPFINVN